MIRPEANDDAFSLEIVSQGWLGDGDQADDTCTHGSIRAVIGGLVVTGSDPEYGIVQSALALLRTLEQDHTPGAPPPGPIRGRHLLCHGCGFPFSLGCGNFGTDWEVKHADGQVSLRAVRHYDALRGNVTHDGVARVPLGDYSREIAQFAQSARDFCRAAAPRRVPEEELPFHEAFWKEFDERLARASWSPTT